MLTNSKRLAGWALLVALAFAVASCGTSKSLTGGEGRGKGQAGGAGAAVTGSLDYMRKVYDNEVYAQSISSRIKFTVGTGKKDISVSGSLKMKKDEVIRIQLTPLGLMEVGRLEFAKDYVLIMDRINKEYIKVGYSDVDFLKKNGLDFYALQALFWNSLFVPGTQKITDSSLKSFTVTPMDAVVGTIVSLKRGNMDYRWTTDNATGRIKAVDVTYSDKTAGTTTVTCRYGSFKPLGRKAFPSDITLTMKSNAVKKGNNMSVNIAISDIDTSDDWETFTQVSGKYRQVSVKDVMNRLLKM